MAQQEDPGDQVESLQQDVNDPKLELAEGSDSDASLSDLPIGHLIDGRYQVLELLGRGGAGVVYKVRHTLMDKVLAIKVLHLNKASSATILRFQQESKLISRLNHPNIIAVHDFGTMDAGHPYMVMDYIEGQPLSKFNFSSLEQKGYISVFTQVCNALAHAHDRGILHRDIKPSNVIVSKDELGNLRATVVDFGIAKLVSGDDVAPSELTRTGELFGTVFYMSPEQCLGNQLDERTDIYSLGCVMYEVLAGNPPFPGKSFFETVFMQINEPPHSFPAVVRKSSWGRRLEVIVLKCLAKMPGDRYQYALQVAGDLKQLESSSVGIFAELSTFIRTLLGRMKAEQRQVVVEQYSLRLTSIIAVLIAVGLIYLPAYVSRMETQKRKYVEILFILDRVVEDVSSNLQMSNETANYGDAAARFQELSADDPQLSRQLNVWMKKLVNATNLSTKLQNLYLNESNPTKEMVVQALMIARVVVPKIGTLWVNAHKAGVEARATAIKHSIVYYNNLGFANFLLRACLILGVPVELLLAWLLVKRFHGNTLEKQEK